MKNPYLIQRGRFQDVKGPITGIDMLIRFDYMGSSEFEFGALPKSLKQMCKQVSMLAVFPTSFKRVDGVGLFIICRPEDKDTVLGYVKRLIGDFRLKEMSYLPEALNPQRDYHKFDFWWDVENQYMFCLGKTNAENVIKSIKAVRDKKEAEGICGWF